MEKGYLISVEGGEGTGKTTLINSIYTWLSNLGYLCIKTREPGGIAISEQIRSVILDKSNTSMDGRTEALLYAAARRQHLIEKVIPALNSGHIVICDRFIDSSLTYQGYARGLGIDNVMNINEFAIDGYMPDLTILLDLKPEIGLKRIHSNKNREVNRLDLEKLDFHQKVYEGYRILARKYPNRIITVNADQSRENVFLDCQKLLKEKFNFLTKQEGVHEENE